MIDTATLQDWSALGAFAVIFGTAVAVCAYFIGRQHSYWHGYYAGVEKARQQFIPRLMRAKVNAQRAGRILGMREAIQLTHGPAPADPARPARTVRPVPTAPGIAGKPCRIKTSP